MSKNQLAKVAEKIKDPWLDDKAKTLLSFAPILAFLIKNTMEEFKDMDPIDIEKNHLDCKPGLRIELLNTENVSLEYGEIVYDLVFLLKKKDGNKHYVHLEIQGDYSINYKLSNRATYYGCRAIDSQKGKNFENNKYNDMCNVTFYWIKTFMDSCHYDVYEIKGKENVYNFDLLKIHMIHLDGSLNHPNPGIRMLDILLSKMKKGVSRLKELEALHINMSDELKKEVESMCDYSVGFIRKVREDERAEAIAYAAAEFAEKRKALAEEKEALAEEKEALAEEKEAFSKEKDALVAKVDAITKEKEELVAKADAIAKEKETLAEKRKALAEDKETLVAKADAIAKEKEALAKEKEESLSNMACSVIEFFSKIEFSKDDIILKLVEILNCDLAMATIYYNKYS